MHHVWHSRWQRFYSRSHWHLVLDLSLLIVIIFLVVTLGSFFFYRPALNWLNGFSGPAVDLNNPPLSWDFSVANSVINVKDGATLKIDFKNNGSVTAADIVINFSTADTDFTLDRLEKISGDTATVSGRQLILQPLTAGNGGEVVLKAYFSFKQPAARIINWKAQSQYTIGQQTLEQTAVMPACKLTADLNVSSLAYYTSPQGDQLGIGPLPPIVGIPTDYWIFWEAKNSGDFKDLVFSGYLPQGVELAAGRSLLTGSFNYNPVSRQITWKVPKLEDQNNSYRLGFEVKIIPIAAQIGQILPLLANTRYYIVDSLTGEVKQGQLDQLTTNLDADHFNSGQGQVVGQ